MRAAVQKRLAEVVDAHFDSRWGSVYWLERADELGIDARREIATLDDLAILGEMRLADLGARPVEDFIPRRFHDTLPAFITSESGGTTGAPSRTAFSEEEFHEAFVDPFIAAADAMRFPRDENWLYIGPSGPHIIGKAARECAVAMGSIDPFMVDFDPRWVRKLPAGSIARTRYLEHVLQQAETVLTTQRIGVLFATPPVLTALGERLHGDLRDSIHGIHLGGLPSSPDFLRALSNDWFCNATVLGGYGNSLAGMCPQLTTSPEGTPEYFPHGDRLVFEVVLDAGQLRGRVMFHRLDLSCFLPNVMERDEAERVDREPGVLPAGFNTTGLCDPRPPANRTHETQIALY